MQACWENQPCNEIIFRTSSEVELFTVSVEKCLINVSRCRTVTVKFDSVKLLKV